MGSAFIFYKWQKLALGFFAFAAILLTLKMGLSYQLVDILTLISVGIFGGWIFDRSKGATTFIVVTVFVVSAIHLIYIYYVDQSFVSENMALMKKQIQETLEQSGANKDVITRFISVIDSGEWKNYIPFAIIFKAFTFAALGLFFIRILFEKLLKMTREGIEGFKLFEQFVFGIIIGLAGVYLLDEETYPFLKMVSVYTLFLFAGLYLFQGLGVIKHIMIKRNLQKYFFIIVPLFFFPALMPILPVIGVMDIWVDYRKFNKDKDDKNDKKVDE